MINYDDDVEQNYEKWGFLDYDIDKKRNLFANTIFFHLIDVYKYLWWHKKTIFKNKISLKKLLI